MRAWWSSLFIAIPACALAGCGEDGPACSDVSFPAPPSDAGDLLFVARPCSEADADGSRERPYSRIGDALANAREGATILVAAGTEYAEGLTIEKSVRILASPPDTIAEEATVALDPPGAGIVLAAGARDVVVRGLIIRRPKAVGIWVPQGADAVIEAVLVKDTERDGDGEHGYGILASDGGSIEIKRTTVSGAPEVGIYIAGGSALIEDTDVSGVSGSGGIRLEAAKGTATIRDSIVEGCAQVGILVSNSTTIVDRTNVFNTSLSAGGLGDGIVVRRRRNENGAYFAEAAAQISNAIVTQNARLGVLFSEGATGSLTDSIVTSNGTVSARAAGVWVQSGAGEKEAVLISNNVIRLNRFSGVGVTSGARAHIENNQQISETTAGTLLVGDQYVEIGDGVGIFAGARADVLSNTIRSNGRFGVLMDEPAAGTTIEGNLIAMNHLLGLVIQHATTGIPPFADNTFIDNSLGPTAILGQNEVPFALHSADFAAP